MLTLLGDNDPLYLTPEAATTLASTPFVFLVIFAEACQYYPGRGCYHTLVTLQDEVHMCVR